ncbi:MAG: hypothetical protein Tsb0020_55350 [Haliangiales bacterium]
MTTLTERSYESDVLLYWQPFYSVDLVTIASGADLTPGHVLGKITASGKYQSSDPTAVDGSETAVAVLLDKADAAYADVAEVRVLTRHATVNGLKLIYDAAIDDATKRATARAELAAAGIVTRL